MSCSILTETNGKESELYKKMESILGPEEAFREYSKIKGDRFKKLFGDFVSAYSSQYSEDMNLDDRFKIAPRVDVNGEPLLKKKTVLKGDNITSYDQYYFQFPDGPKYINKVKFAEMNSYQVEDVTKVLLNAFVRENTTGDLEDLSGLDPSKITETIDNFIASYRNSETDEELLRRLGLVEKYKDDFKLEVINKIESLGLSYRQRVVNEKGDLESEVSETEKSEGLNIAESFEKNSKDTAPVRIKLLLSLIPDTEINPAFQSATKRLMTKYNLTPQSLAVLKSRFKKKEMIEGFSNEDMKDLSQERVMLKRDSFLNKPKFAEFDDVWGTLQPMLSDIVLMNSNGGKLVNTFELMKLEMQKLIQVKPWVAEVLGRMNNMDENQKAQFVQAFTKTKLNFIVTEVNNEDKTYKVINATSTNSRDSKIRGDWSNNFFKKFVSGNVLTGKSEILLIKGKLENERREFGKKATGQPLEVQKREIIQYIPNLLEAFKASGVDIEAKDIIAYVRANGGDEKAIDSILDLSKAIDRTFDYVLDENTSFVVGDERINPFDNQDGIKRLSMAKALFETDMTDSSILANNGKSYFAYSNPSYLHNIVNEWKINSEGIEKLATLTYNKGSRWIKYLLNTETDRNGNLISTNAAKRELESKRRIEDVQVVLESSFKSKGENDGKDTKEISPGDALNNSIVKTLGHRFGGKNYAQTILAADKGRKMEIAGFESFDSKIDFIDGEWYISDESLNVLADYFDDEYSRMKVVSNELNTLDESELVVHYHTGKKNGLKSQIFPSLSPENMDKNSLEYVSLYKDGKPLGEENGVYPISGMTNEQRAVVKGIIKKSLIERLNDNLKNMNEFGVVNTEIGDYSNLSVDQRIINSYEGSNSPIHAMSGDYFMNSVINTVEYNKLFLGDPAYFKDMSDMIKRTPASYTDGLQLFLSESDQLYFNQATIKGVEIDSRYVDLIRSSLKDKSIADSYTNGGVNSTDAQAWITPNRWRFLKKRLGQWSTGKDSHQSAWDKMQNPDGEMLSDKEMKLVAQPLKGVYFEINSGRPVYLKYSQAVLIPQLVKGNKMQKLLDKMTKDADGNILSEENEIHEVVTIDGVKVGAVAPTKIHESNGDMSDDFELNSVSLKNVGWKLQQDLPTKLAHETMLGSQIQKNILAGIDVTKNYEFNGKKNVSGQEILDMIHSSISELSEIGKQSLIDEFSITEDEFTGKLTINNKDRLYSALISEFKSRGGSDNVISALEKDMPFDAIPQVRNKVENVFMSMMNKKLTKIYTNGGSFIQISQFGFDSISDEQLSGIKIVSDNYNKKGLKPPHYDEKTKKYMPGQCFLPHSALIKLLPNGTDWSSMSGKELMKMIDPSALQLVSYRIPNQGMSSNDAMEIVGILPPGVGDSIIAYDAVPTKTGSDQY